MRYEGITRVLGIPGFFAVEVKVLEGGLDIWLEREGRRFCCGRCGQAWSVPHDTYEGCVQDLLMTGRVVYLHFLKGRVRCCAKEPEVEHLGWVGKNDRQTMRLKWAVYEECKDTSVSAVAGRERVDVVVIDMWKAYRKSVGKYLAKAEIVFDKYHVMEHLNRAIDEVRKAEARELSKDERTVLKGKRWVLLKGAEHLSPEEQGTLCELLKANETLQKAYLLKEEFREFYRLDFSWHWKRGLVRRILNLARNYLRGWMKRAMESVLGPLKKFCKMLKRHEQGVIGYFVKYVTLGTSEGINNKIKTIKKRAYGYSDPKYFILKIYQACGRI